MRDELDVSSPVHAGESARDPRAASFLDAVRQESRRASEDLRARMILGRPVEDEESRPDRTVAEPDGGNCAARLRRIETATPDAASSFRPTIKRWLPPRRRNSAEVGSLIAMASPSQARADRGEAGPGRRLDALPEERVQ